MRLFSLLILAGLAGCAQRNGSQPAKVPDGTSTILVGQPWPKAQAVARRAGYELHDASQLAMAGTPDGFYIDMSGRRGLLVFRDPRRDVVSSMEWIENWDGPTKFRVDHDVESFDVLDHFTTVTNRDGRFSGSVNGETTYLRWLCLPTAPAPPLNKVDLWANDGGAWSKIQVPLDAASQERVFSGGRSIALPTVTLPAPATSRASSGAAELPPPSASTAPALAGPATRKALANSTTRS